MSEPIRILVADDHPVVREGLVTMLSTEADFEVVAQVGTGDDAIRETSRLEPMVASKLFRRVRESPHDLTPRELEVLGLVAEGGSNKAIAKALFVTERTVKFHVSQILSKVNASN